MSKWIDLLISFIIENRMQNLNSRHLEINKIVIAKSIEQYYLHLWQISLKLDIFNPILFYEDKVNIY